MRLHDRYLFRELVVPLAYCLGGFLVFWISYFFFTEVERMQESKLHALDCVEYAAALTPGFFVMALPVALLLALLYALTHHSRHNEITALRAAGVGLWRLCAPYFIVGLAATGFYFFLNEMVVPRGDDWAQQILSRYVQKGGSAQTQTHFLGAGYHNVRANRIWQIGEFDFPTATLLNLNVAWTQPDGSWRALRAARGVYRDGLWTFSDVRMFSQQGAHGNLVPTLATNEIAMPDFDETPKQMLLANKFSDAEGLLNSHSMDIPLADLQAYLQQNPDLSAKDRARLLTKFYGRLAAPWTCFVVVLIAIPFGVQPGRRNLFFGVAGSIFICFSYFNLQQIGLALGVNGTLPGWVAAWLPNIIFAILGIVLTLRIR